MTLWKAYCQENKYPGLWRHWFRNRCVAFGWPPSSDFTFDESADVDTGWAIARNALKQIVAGDSILVTLKGHRVSRIGTVTRVRVADDQWNPLVPSRAGLPNGQLGRRVEVRWDLMCGPESTDAVVHLPAPLRLSGAALRLTIAKLAASYDAEVRAAMSDPINWVNLNAGFRHERSLSDYIATYPHRLEDGLVPHPDAVVRERVFKDSTRLDVLLMDRKQRPVIVECKQDAPSVANVAQLGHYLDLLRDETGKPEVRGLLVHGGSRRVSSGTVAACQQDGRIELVYHELRVDFDASLAS